MSLGIYIASLAVIPLGIYIASLAVMPLGIYIASLAVDWKSMGSMLLLHIDF